MKNRVIAILLVLAMLVTVVPLYSFVAQAAEGGCVSVLVDAPTTATVVAGGQLILDLTKFFADSDGHKLTYALSGDESSEHSKISGSSLYFTTKNAGDYEVIITATCSGGNKVSHTVTVTVEEAGRGLDAQYNYDESPAKQVTVYVTISNDGTPLLAADGETVLCHLEVTVPYFDLALYDLEQFYRYHTSNGVGGGEYIDDKIVQRPTGLHLYIYLLERYYMGLSEEDCCQGTSGVLQYYDQTSVMYMHGAPAYDSNGSTALTITGSATSLYMSNFWGHDENLMYYRNHCYPYMDPGWGSTSDYIVLSDGDTWDVAMFTDWNFYSTGGKFCCFDKDTYKSLPGGELTFDVLAYGTTYEESNFSPMTDLEVGLYDENWELLETVKWSDDGKSTVSFKAPKTEGTYYLLGVDPNRETSESKYAPATAKIIVSSTIEEDPEPTPTTAPFLSISANGVELSEASITCKGTIDLGSEENEDYNNVYEGVPYYHIVVPAGTETVDVVYSADTDILTANDTTAYGYETDLAVDATSSATIRAVTLSDSYTLNDDGTQTVKMPVADYVLSQDGSGKAITLESGTDSSFAPIVLFTFEYADSTDPDDGKEDVIYGDINGDGVVDSTDAALAYRFANGKTQPTDKQKMAADVSGDGTIDSTDAALIYRYANGKISKFPVDNK